MKYSYSTSIFGWVGELLLEIIIYRSWRDGVNKLDTWLEKDIFLIQKKKEFFFVFFCFFFLFEIFDIFEIFENKTFINYQLYNI